MSTVTIQQAMDLAMQHHRAGRLPEAEAVYRQILAAAPEHPDVLHLLGLLAMQCGQPTAAVELIRRAINVNPQAPSFHDTLGQALSALDRVDEAIAEYRSAIALRPDFAEAHTNLSVALMGIERFEEATEHLHAALRAQPESAQAHNNLGSCCNALGRIDNAISSYRKALSYASDNPTIHYNLGTTLLLKGDFPQGLREYEWRWQVPGLKLLRPTFTQPLWSGDDLNGQRILLHAEQGYGDAIQFIRYAPLVVQRGGKVVVCCPGPLERLMKTVPGVDHVLPADETPVDFDVHCPLLHLPLVFGTSLQTIPQNIPYLHPDPARASEFKERIGSDGRLNVGIAWAGRPEHTNDRNRSLRLDQLAPLLHVPGVRFFSLQFGPAADQLKDPPAGMDLTDWTSELSDFADSAALVQNLDLIVTVDTAIAHLAGALGKPVFLLLPFVPDWRWMLDRRDSPWYPTARLFRQSLRGDWETPIARVVEAMRERAG